jgi:hypothetical protein
VHLFVKGREPQHFKGTRFLVDEFHYSDHTNCSQGYCSGTCWHAHWSSVDLHDTDRLHAQMRRCGTG